MENVPEKVKIEIKKINSALKKLSKMGYSLDIVNESAAIINNKILKQEIEKYNAGEYNFGENQCLLKKEFRDKNFSNEHIFLTERYVVTYLT